MQTGAIATLDKRANPFWRTSPPPAPEKRGYALFPLP